MKKKKTSPTKIAASLALIMAAAGLGAQSSSGNRAAQAEPKALSTPESVDRQIRDYVVESVQKNLSAKSFDEWTQSGYTPAEVIEYAASFHSKAHLTALCRALGTLTGESLSLYAEELGEEKYRKLLNCSGPLLDRIKAYRERARIALNHAVMVEKMGDLADLPGAKDFADNEAEPVEPIPMEEIQIDAEAGEVLSPNYQLKDGQVALTLDDGPHPTYTRQILADLARYGAKVNFFSVGEMAKAPHRADISKECVAQGHIVGSHSWDHPNMRKLSREKGVKAAEANILAGRKAVMEASGVDMPFFRFPYGADTQALGAFVKDQKMASFFWTIDSGDYATPDPVKLYKNLHGMLERKKQGIILMHDMKWQTMTVMPKLLAMIKDMGMTMILFVPH
jgi:peptidoglycan/xylan/chitin deacetylase (PgdA/CDA1 family)